LVACRPTGFTIIELLVVISIIALLIAILLPILGRSRDQAQASVCQSNLRQLGVASHSYAADQDDYLPGRDQLGNALMRLGWGVSGQLNPFLAKRNALTEETYGLPVVFGKGGYTSNDGKLFLCPSTDQVVNTTNPGSFESFNMRDWGNTYIQFPPPGGFDNVRVWQLFNGTGSSLSYNEQEMIGDNTEKFPGPANLYDSSGGTGNIPSALRLEVAPHNYTGGTDLSSGSSTTTAKARGIYYVTYDGSVSIRSPKIATSN
jgi:prepilin-type N-terminal cleavage/methylation domain-containing protein